MKVTVVSKTLQLIHTFTISRGSKDVTDSVFVMLKNRGHVGWGEASPNTRYGETTFSATAAMAEMIDLLPDVIEDHEAVIRNITAAPEGQYAARAAMDMAIMDLAGKVHNQPLYRLWDLDPTTIPPTSMTIGLDLPENMAERLGYTTGFKILKIKLGGPHDRDIITAIRKVTNKVIRVDANEGWTDREQAIREIEWLAERNVELIEQPMPAAQANDMVWLKQRSPVPLIADEAFVPQQDLKDLAHCYHGINVKLMKCGGTLAAREAMDQARKLGLSIMLGCMVESSVGIAAALHLAPRADYIDLDGNLLIGNDPFDGLFVRDGIPQLNDRPGLGVTPNTEIMS